MSPRKKWTTRDTGSFKSAGALRCGYCRKRAYPTRGLAKKALRRLYPGDVGQAMHTYRCVSGGQGWHVGHRDPRFEPLDPADDDCGGPHRAG